MVVLDKEGAVAIGIGMTMAGSAIATAWAQATIGASIMGVLAERPEETFKLIVYMALPEIILILGFVVALMMKDYLGVAGAAAAAAPA